MDEASFIAALRSLPLHPAACGLADDAAALAIGGETMVLTHDTVVQGIHVRDDEDPADIAWKLVAVNLSDLATKGAAPIGIMLSHMLGGDDERFLEGLDAVLDTYGVPLLGGDTVSGSAPRSWGCTAIGLATYVPVPNRRDAKAGDSLYVTGTLGRAMLGMGERGSGSANDLAYRRPAPLLAEGQALAPFVTAMMDVSDGLLLDAARMAGASGCTFDIFGDTVPVADPSRRGECLRWGDDYQLLFTAPPNAPLPIAATRIGTVTARGPVPLLLDGEEPGSSEGLGYVHR